jgi:subtilisin family serine protease
MIGMLAAGAWAAPTAGIPNALGDRHVPWDRLKQTDVVPGELVVVYRDGATGPAGQAPGAWPTPPRLLAAHRDIGATVRVRAKRMPMEVLRVPGAATPAALRAAARRYADDPDVLFVEPNYRVRASAVPNDPGYPYLWGMQAIGAPSAWDSSTGSSSIVVAIIDSGVQTNHADLAANMWVNPGEDIDSDGLATAADLNGIDDDGNGYVDDLNGYDFTTYDPDPSDQNGHGTHVAGTVGAVGNNATGVVGVCWRVKLCAVRGLDASGYGNDADLALGIEYVAWFDGLDHGGPLGRRPRIHLSNNSWGGPGYSAVTYAAIGSSRLSDQLFIAAAGNDAADNDAIPSYPACYNWDNIISVASLTAGNPLTLSYFSNYGLTTVDIGAPGENIVSTYYNPTNNNMYQYLDGTSMASPHAAGAAGLLYSIAPNSRYTVIRDAILNAAREPANQVPDLLNRTVTGGKLHLPTAILRLYNLLVTPRTTVKLAGPPGGPFPPGQANYVVQNNNPTSSINWRLTLSQPWLTPGTNGVPAASPVNGTLPAATTGLVFAVTNAIPPTLPEGLYTNDLAFTNLTTVPGEPQTDCAVLLKVSHNYQYQSTPYVWQAPGGGATEIFAPGQAVPIPFAFRYYNRTYTTLYADDSGALTFDNPVFPVGFNTPLPTPASDNPTVFPLWDELLYIGGTSHIYAEADLLSVPPRMIVTWQNMAHTSDPTLRMDFQAVLYENAASNSTVACHYRNVGSDANPTTVFGCGRRATVGVQDDGAFLASQYECNGTNADYGAFWLADRQGLLYTWRDRLPDTTAPTVTAIRVISLIPGDPISGAEGYALLDVRFSEIVTGLVSTADFDFSQSGVTGSRVTLVAGGGERFLVEIEGFKDVGLFVVGVVAGAVADLAGNPNPASGFYSAVIPYVSTQLYDNFENGQGLWQISTNTYPVYTARGWELGRPPATNNPAGNFWPPTNAYSGSFCWGTVLSNKYPVLMNGWLQAPRVFVFSRPTIDFRLCLDLGYGTYMYNVAPDGDYALVEVNIGSGWVPVVVFDSYDVFAPHKTFGNWGRVVYELPAVYANRALDIRIRMVSDNTDWADGAGVYIDNFRVLSLESPGIWLVGAQPDPLAPASPTNLTLTTRVYNSFTQTVTQANGIYGMPDSAVTLTNNAASYGAIPSGGFATSRVVTVRTAASSFFSTDRVPLTHDAYQSATFLNDNYVMLGIAPLTVTNGRNRMLVAQALGGVTDWMGRPLGGDGGRASSLYQVIYAGTNRVIDPPTAYGAPTVDDRVLYSYYNNLPYGRFGAENVSSNLGLFDRAFLHGLTNGLPTTNRVYARAWDAATFDLSVAYGDSALYTMNTNASQTHDFGAWVVGKPTQYRRDSNGDGIPDGWSIGLGQDPRQSAAALPPAMNVRTNLPGINDDGNPTNNIRAPRRAFALGNFVYIASRKNTTPAEDGAVLIYDRALTARKFAVSNVVVGGTTYKFDPAALCVDTNRNRVVVGDLSRVIVFNVNTNTGALSYTSAVPPFGSTGTPDQIGRFKDVRDVAVDPTGTVFAVDSQIVTNRFKHYRVQKLPPGNYTNASEFAALVSGPGSYDYPTPPSALAFDRTRMCVANPTRGLVDIYETKSGAFSNRFGLGPGTGLGNLESPAGLSIGVAGRLYVMEQGNHRLQIFASNGVAQAVYPPEALGNSGYFGAELGRFRLPEGVHATISDRHEVLAADTGNNRVQWLRLTLDVDGDGMDDVWEDSHGLNSSDPSDAFLDPDGDLVPNIGEFRANTDPGKRDTNGNGGSDQWDMMNGLNPLGPPTPKYSPPAVTSVVASITNPVPGQTVTVTVTFNTNIAAAANVRLGLSGGAAMMPLAMTRISARVYQFSYLVGIGDFGPVNVAVSGAYDTTSPVPLDQDPLISTTPAVFTVMSPSFWITSIRGRPAEVAWDVVIGGTYVLQQGPTPTGAWVDVVTRTAGTTGTLSYTNPPPAGASMFYRVKRVVGP